VVAASDWIAFKSCEICCLTILDFQFKKGVPDHAVHFLTVTFAEAT
jgi:hypothetical protein